MRMQIKLTLVFLVVGLLSTGTVGFVAHMMVMRDFQLEARKNAFARFQQDFAQFIQIEPNWRQGVDEEKFTRFVVNRLNRRPPPEFINPVGPTGIDRHLTPPFRFMVVDPDGVVIKGAEDFSKGTVVPDSVMSKAVPIEVDGVVVAYASLIGDVSLTEQDRHYLNAVQEAILTGMMVSIVLSVLCGIVFGSGMSRSLKRLTKASRKMYTSLGERQQIPVVGNDEISQLTRAFNDMSRELTQAHDELREMGIRDVLTGIYNRRYFDEQARQAYEQAVRYKQSLAVMIGDLDHFKRVNDDFSHEMGDRVLRQIGQLLSTTVRKSDVVARYGGEEFVILFPNTDLDQAALSCEKIRAAIEVYPWHEFDPELRITMSMGLCAETSLENVEKMISCADKKLYQAKEHGRNRVETKLAG